MKFPTWVAVTRIIQNPRYLVEIAGVLDYAISEGVH